MQSIKGDEQSFWAYERKSGLGDNGEFGVWRDILVSVGLGWGIGAV